MKVVAIRSLAQWADAIAALDAGGRLAERTALVPSEAHAHALRVALLDRAPRALAGTRFMTPAAAARAMLEAAGVPPDVDEAPRRPLRVRALRRRRPVLASYRAEELRSPGWDLAIAATIEQLEAAALRPEDLDALSDPRAADLAALWRWLDADAGASWTVPRAEHEAARYTWPFAGPVLALAASHARAADARLIMALPRLTLGVVLGRRATASSLARLQAHFGPDAAAVAEAMAAERPEPSGPRELDLLAAHLFTPTRPRGPGPDGSVSLELHAGTDDELEAAARWVAEQVSRGTPMQDIAVLAPSPEPLATLVADRIAALPWPTRTPVYLASGRPAVTIAAGARLRRVVRGFAAAADASIASLWRAIQASQRRDASRQLVTVMAALDDALARLIRGGVTDDLVGHDALAVIDDALGALRFDSGRYGEPAIYVGTVQGAAGLRFTAVRVLGLVESVYPGTLRGDPLLPPELRRRLPSIASDADFAAMRLHALDEVIRGAGQTLALSAARTEGPGGEREPAGLFLDLAAALGRRPGIPTARDLAQDLRVPARDRPPRSVACWLDRVARGDRELPSAWIAVDVIAPARVNAVAGTGELGDAALTARVPGCDPQHPIAATELRELLSCPHRFLLERILRHRPRAEPPDDDRLAPVAYGTLLHDVVRQFLHAHGAAFSARDQDLAHWQAYGERLADAALDDLLATYRLRGQAAVDAERHRLRRDLHTYLSDDWAEPSPRRWVDAERRFDEVVIETAAGALHVHGRIDRIDVAGGVTHVRDLKTGRRPSKPTPADDIQLAVYVAATRQHAAAWQVPDTVACAYTYVDHRASDRRRGFAPGELAAQRWFDVAAGLLREHNFVRTADSKRCTSCAFAPACEGADPNPARGAAAALRSLMA
ncbi:MAG TPA: PD-(D/E)XK nuclease family protein [Kofleriaceae bacterium]